MQRPHEMKFPDGHIHIWCTYGMFGREITKYTVIYGLQIRFWPTLGTHHPTRRVIVGKRVFCSLIVRNCVAGSCCCRTKLCNGVYTVSLAGKSLNVRPYTVYIFNRGLPLPQALPRSKAQCYRGTMNSGPPDFTLVCMH